MGDIAALDRSDGLVNRQPGDRTRATHGVAWSGAPCAQTYCTYCTSVALIAAGHSHAYELVGGLPTRALEEFSAMRRLAASEVGILSSVLLNARHPAPFIRPSSVSW